jgi:hypothetical protein
MSVMFLIKAKIIESAEINSLQQRIHNLEEAFDQEKMNQSTKFDELSDRVEQGTSDSQNHQD